MKISFKDLDKSIQSKLIALDEIFESDGVLISKDGSIEVSDIDYEYNRYVSTETIYNTVYSNSKYIKKASRDAELNINNTKSSNFIKLMSTDSPIKEIDVGNEIFAIKLYGSSLFVLKVNGVINVIDTKSYSSSKIDLISLISDNFAVDIISGAQIKDFAVYAENIFISMAEIGVFKVNALTNTIEQIFSDKHIGGVYPINDETIIMTREYPCANNIIVYSLTSSAVIEYIQDLYMLNVYPVKIVASDNIYILDSIGTVHTYDSSLNDITYDKFAIKDIIDIENIEDEMCFRQKSMVTKFVDGKILPVSYRIDDGSFLFKDGSVQICNGILTRKSLDGKEVFSSKVDISGDICGINVGNILMYNGSTIYVIPFYKYEEVKSIALALYNSKCNNRDVILLYDGESPDVSFLNYEGSTIFPKYLIKREGLILYKFLDDMDDDMLMKITIPKNTHIDDVIIKNNNIYKGEKWK